MSRPTSTDGAPEGPGGSPRGLGARAAIASASRPARTSGPPRASQRPLSRAPAHSAGPSLQAWIRVPTAAPVISSAYARPAGPLASVPTAAGGAGAPGGLGPHPDEHSCPDGTAFVSRRQSGSCLDGSFARVPTAARSCLDGKSLVSRRQRPGNSAVIPVASRTLFGSKSFKRSDLRIYLSSFFKARLSRPSFPQPYPQGYQHPPSLASLKAGHLWFPAPLRKRGWAALPSAPSGRSGPRDTTGQRPAVSPGPLPPVALEGRGRPRLAVIHGCRTGAETHQLPFFSSDSERSLTAAPLPSRTSCARTYFCT